MVSMLGLWLGIEVAGIWYLRTVRDLLLQISPENRTMQPKQVWLQLIPLFGLYWQFKVTLAAVNGSNAEYVKRGLPLRTDFGFWVGILACCGFCLMVVLAAVDDVPEVLFSGALTLWIVFWVRINRYRRTLTVLNDNHILDPRWQPRPNDRAGE